MRIRVTALLFFITVIISHAQPVTITSLFKELDDDIADTSRVNIYNSIAQLYWNTNTDSALLMSQKAISLAQDIAFEKGLAVGYMSKGVAFTASDNFNQALNCHLQSLRISERLGLEDLTANNYNNIGIVYTNLQNYTLALHYLKKSLIIAEKNRDKDASFDLLTDIAEVYSWKNEYDSALTFNNHALKIARRRGDEPGIAEVLFNIGDLYQKREEYKKSLTYLYQSLSISERLNSSHGVARCYNAIAYAYYKKNRFNESIQAAEVSVQKSVSLNDYKLSQSSYHVLYLCYERLGDYKTALHYRNLEIDVKTDLHANEKEKEIRTLQTTYDLEKKQYQIDLLKKDRRIQQEEIAKVKFRRNILAGGIIMLCLLAFSLLRSNAEKRKFNRQLKLKNREIITQNNQLKDLNGVKTKLISIISHDLRSPINSLQGIVNLMKASNLSPEEIRHLTTRISDDLFLTAELLDNMLVWAKSQMDGMQVNPTSFDLQKIITQSVKLVQSHAKEKKVGLEVSESANAIYAYADENLINIVVRNLLTNAVKFSVANSAVLITSAVKGEYVEVSIKDHGMGISLENQERIFNMKASFSTTGTAQERGSGLGLILCKELVEKNGGVIWFESEPGKGSSFSFTIPISKQSTVEADS